MVFMRTLTQTSFNSLVPCRRSQRMLCSSASTAKSVILSRIATVRRIPLDHESQAHVTDALARLNTSLQLYSGNNCEYTRINENMTECFSFDRV